MKITPIRTHSIAPGEASLAAIIDRYVPQIPPRSILAVTSKIVSVCENRIIPLDSIDRQELIRREADYYRTPLSNPYHYTLTIKSGILIAAAGIDESNGNGHYVLWPADPQASANRLRHHLRTKHNDPIGVMLTDSHSTVLRRGALGLGLAHSGFAALSSYRGTGDLFGYNYKSEVANVLDGLAAAAVAVMGEGAESTPLALIEDAGFVHFQDRNPTADELAELKIPVEQDLFADMINHIPWDKRPDPPAS